MTVSQLVENIRRRPLVGIVVALLAPLIAQRVADSATIGDTVLILSWIIITYELRRLLGTGPTAVTSVVLAAVLYWGLWQHGNRFTIVFSDKPLNKGKVTLARVFDPIKQSQIYIDPNFPNLFGIRGVMARNDGPKPLQIDAAYLSFSTSVKKWQENSGVWYLSSGPEGWTTFSEGFGVNSVQPGHPYPIGDFLGTPIPTTDIKVRLTLVYGSENTSADFTIAPSP